MAKFFTASEGQDHINVKALVSGLSGSGKTTCLSKAQKVLVLEPSPQAQASIVASNPDAKVFIVESIEDLYDALYSLRNAEETTYEGLPALKVTLQQDPSRTKGRAVVYERDLIVQSIVLDDLEEIQDMFKADIVGESVDQVTVQQWGFIIDRTFRVVRAFRNIPCNFFVVCKVSPKADGDSLVYSLALSGQKLDQKIMGLVNCAAYMFRKETDEGVQYFAGFQLPDKYPSKGHPSLQAIEVPDASIWWGKMRDHIGGLRTPAPAPHEMLPDDAPKKMQRRGRRGDEVQEERPKTLDERTSDCLNLIRSVKGEKDWTKAAEVVRQLENDGLSGSTLMLLKTNLAEKQNSRQEGESNANALEVVDEKPASVEQVTSRTRRGRR